jgi:AcrR family transcriptional regulator
MPRPPKFGENQIITAASRLVARHGAAGATIGAIARAVGAPTGSIYHRFDSRDRLLAEVWLRAARAFQTAFFERLAGPTPAEAGLAAALYMVQRVREQPREARLLLHHRREDFGARGWPRAMRRQAAELGAQIEVELARFSRRLCGAADPRTLRCVRYAVVVGRRAPTCRRRREPARVRR